MERLIRTITDHYLNKLSSGREFFSQAELVEAGFPDFLTARIRLELIRNLQDTLQPPESDWANMHADSVRESWRTFLGTIREETRLPGSYARPVIESAVGDLLELLITPRETIPEYIFGSDDRLDLEAVRERCEWIVVYSYFASAIPRFMEKKERDTLTREQAVRIVQRLDERVTSHYTSLNWAQLFEPWFELIGERIEPDLFARFFMDKAQPGIARHFRLEQEPVPRGRLIEILSRPPLEDESEDSRTDSGGIGKAGSAGVRETALKKEQSPGGETGRQPTESGRDQAHSEDYRKTEKEDGESEQQKASTLQKSESRQSASRFQQSEAEREENLLARFRKDETDEEDRPLYENLKSDNGEEDEEEEPLFEKLSGHRKSEDEEDVPIWQRFSGMDTEEDDESGAPGDPSHADRFRLDEIRKYASDMEAEFVEELFGGDENAYLDALDRIAQFPDWKQAGIYITREIFNRNLIDIYSDTAIDFTDRMQTRFLEKGRKG
ncbi:hypothetical protein QA596_10935 [Balneolales bacterium ANBcel1]|nr:hypothetical protein [Balneolales bacterium ANBcel1]